MAKELTIKINIEGQDVVLTSKQLEIFKKNADNLKKSLEELGDRTEQNAEQFDKLKGDLEALEKIFAQTKEEVTDTGDEFGKTDGKAKSLRTQIRELTNQLQALGPRTADNAAQFDALTTQLIELQEIQEDVGFQTQKLDDALGALPGPIGQAVSQFKVFDDGLKNARAAMIGLTKQFPILKNAIAATGIGALVILIGALVAAVVKAFNTFKPLQDAVARLGVLFDVLEKAIQPLIDLIGEGLVVVLDGLARALAFVTGQTEEFNQALADKAVIESYAQGIKDLEDNLKLYGDLNSELQNQQIELAKAYQEELKALAEDEVRTEEEKLRIKKGLTERYLRDVNNLNKKADQEETERLNKITEERLKLQQDFQKELNNLRNENRILEAKTEVEAQLLRLDIQRDNDRKSILESQRTQEQKNQLLLERDKKYLLEREIITRNAETKIQGFLEDVLKLGLELTSDVADQRAKIIELQYRKEREDLVKNFEEIRNIYELYGEDVTNLKQIEAEALKLLEQRKNRDLIRLNENYILNRLDQERRIFEGIMNTSEATRIMIETDAADIANAYMKATTFVDVFLGKLSKRMSEQMMMEFDRIRDLREVYKEQYDLIADAIEEESRLLKESFDNNLISEQLYYSEVERLQQQAVENRARFVQQQVALDRLEVESRRESADQTQRIAENLADFLSQVAGESTGLQIASALTDAAVSVARIITDTQRAIIAFTAAVAPLGPAGVPIAAAYATKAKISAALGIATITAGAVGKLRGLRASSQQTSSSGGSQSNGLGRGYADGGLVTGPGTSTSDSIPARLSNGEFVMNGASTAMFLPMLEMLNNAGRQTSVPSLMTTLPDAPESNNKSEMIVKTYVVESDMTSIQHKNARLKNLSTL